MFIFIQKEKPKLHCVKILLDNISVPDLVFTDFISTIKWFTNDFNFKIYSNLLFAIKEKNNNLERISIYLKQPIERKNDFMYLQKLIDFQQKNDVLFTNYHMFDNIIINNVKNGSANLFFVGIDVIKNNNIRYKIYLKNKKIYLLRMY